VTSAFADLLLTLLAAAASLVIGPLCYRWGVHRATARLQPALHRFLRMAYTDHLTGLPNGRAAVEYLETSEGEQWVAMVDVRWLRAVNNSRGHSAGDQLLQAVADALARVAEPDGQAARFSGDEFLLSIPDTGDPREPDSIAERIRAELAGYGAVHPDAPQPQVCIGWAATRQVSRSRVLEAVGIAVAHAKALAQTHGDGSTVCSVRYQDELPSDVCIPFQRRGVDRVVVRS
jgi:diguanylate cyclase (GGDEF)-like protein